MEKKKTTLEVKFADKQACDTVYLEIGKWVDPLQFSEKVFRKKVNFLYTNLSIDQTIFNLDELIYIIDIPDGFEDVTPGRKGAKKHCSVSLYLNVRKEILDRDRQTVMIRKFNKQSHGISKHHRSFAAMEKVGKEFLDKINETFPD
jgi:hypothetical protein